MKWSFPQPQMDAALVPAAAMRCFLATASDQRRVLQPLVSDLMLLDSGLDSLCFANIVAQLEDELGVDPFSDLDEASYPATYGEFVQLYEAATQRAAGGPI